jgi:hypothetical protein
MASILGSDLSKGIGQLLCEKQLCVPPYQRSYAWKREQVDDLFQDLRGAIENERPYYFLGSIVGFGETDDRVEIVDGQQRLATVTILLAAIRDHLYNSGDISQAAKFENNYLFKEEGLANPTTEPRLTLSDTDNDFFQKRILSKPDCTDRQVKAPRVSHKLIIEASKKAATFVKEITGSRTSIQQRAQFDKWIKYIRQNAKVIFIQVHDVSDAFTVFETLNDRGLELTIADLSKNYLFGTSKKRIDEVKHYWTRMVATLQASTESEITKVYMHHLWSSLNGITREREMFKKIREKIQSEQSAVDFSLQLADKAELYTATRSSTTLFWTPYGPRSKAQVNILNHLKITQIRMLLLAILDKFNQAEVEKVLPFCISWNVRLSVAGGSPGDAEAFYVQNALKIRQDTIKDAASLIGEMAKVVPNDLQFQTAFAVEESSPISKPIARYYLQCLERALNGEEDAHLGEDNELTGSLEHILPLIRTPGQLSAFLEHDAERLVWRLSNLTLLARDLNNSLGNKEYALKLPIYSVSAHRHTRDIVNFGSAWNEKTINDRQDAMAKLAVLAWPVALPERKSKQNRVSSGPKNNI